jgi:hypothetical protein
VKCVSSTNAARIWSASENTQMSSEGKQNREARFRLKMYVDGNSRTRPLSQYAYIKWVFLLIQSTMKMCAMFLWIKWNKCLYGTELMVSWWLPEKALEIHCRQSPVDEPNKCGKCEMHYCGRLPQKVPRHSHRIGLTGWYVTILFGSTDDSKRFRGHWYFH